MVARLPHKQKVVGSNPTLATCAGTEVAGTQGRVQPPPQQTERPPWADPSGVACYYRGMDNPNGNGHPSPQDEGSSSDPTSQPSSTSVDVPSWVKGAKPTFAQTPAELRLAARAIKQRWPVRESLKKKIMRDIEDNYEAMTSKERSGARRAAIAAEAQNQADEHLALKYGRIDDGKDTESVRERHLEVRFGE